MSRTISDDRLGAMHATLSGAIRKRSGQQWLEYNGTAIIEGHDLICLMDELVKRRNIHMRKGPRYGKITLAMAAMQVGDVIILPPTPQSSLTTSRASARKKMGVPDARWHCEDQNGHVRCERRPDGSDHIFGRGRNPAIAVMAAMPIGTSVVIEGKMYAGIRQQARQESGSPAAKWASTNLANGKTKVKRVA